MISTRSILRSLFALTLATAGLTAQSRALSGHVGLDPRAATIRIQASGAPHGTMALMFSTQHLLQQGIRTPWGVLMLDPTSIVATVPIQLDNLGLSSIQGILPRPYDPFILSVQAVVLSPSGAVLSNPVEFAGAGNVANVANVLSYNGGSFSASADGNRGDLIEVKNDAGVVLGAGTVQQNGSSVNLSGSVPAGTTWVGLYRNGVLISWVRC